VPQDRASADTAGDDGRPHPGGHPTKIRAVRLERAGGLRGQRIQLAPTVGQHKRQTADVLAVALVDPAGGGLAQPPECSALPPSQPSGLQVESDLVELGVESGEQCVGPRRLEVHRSRQPTQGV
jgi:hypothetical protein